MTYNEARREIRALMDEHIFTVSALEKRLGWNKDEIVFLLNEMGFETTCVRMQKKWQPP